AQQAASPALLLVDVNVVTGARELLGAGETGRTRADDRDLFAGLPVSRLRPDPSFRESAIDDGAFDRLDGDRRVLEVERARSLAGRRADASGEFREVVGRKQIARGLPPIAAIDEIVPVGDLVVDRA